MLVHFVFIGEGTSDDGMIPHLESLCVEAGANEVMGVAPDFRRLPSAIGHSVAAKLKAALTLEPQANLVFIHRDADGRDATRRYAEIAESVAACVCNLPTICVVPIQETEAWLLLDESAIRRAVGRPNSSVALDLPVPTAVERVARPKERLKEVLVRASEATGRRLERIRQDFPLQRRALLQDLVTGGPLEHVPSWSRLRADLRRTLTEILANGG